MCWHVKALSYPLCKKTSKWLENVLRDLLRSVLPSVWLFSPWVSLTSVCCIPSIILTRKPHWGCDISSVIAPLFVAQFVWGHIKEAPESSTVCDIWYRRISFSLFPSVGTHGSRTAGPFHNDAPKYDSPLCSVMNLLPQWDEITCCVSSWGTVIRSDYQAMHRIFHYLQGMLITPLLDFSVTPAINPHHGLVWWNHRTLLNVINSHDRFWTSLHRVLWSREITPGYCKYLMDPRVSINVEKLFTVLSFHVHQHRFFYY